MTPGGEPAAEAGRRAGTALMPRGLVVLLGVAGAVLLIAGLRSIADLFGPVFLGIVLVIAVHPLQRMIARVLPGWIAITVALLTIYAVVLGLLAGLGLSIARLATTLPGYAGQFQSLVNQGAALLGRFGVSERQITSTAGAIGVSPVLGFLQTLLGQLQGALSGFVLLVTVLVFLVADANQASERLRLLLGPRTLLSHALNDFAGGVRRYLVVSTVFGLIVAVLDTAALFALGVPLALLWGLVSFLTNYIPNIGFLLGLIPPALLGLLEGGPRTALLVVAVYSVLNLVIQAIIQPRVTGDSVGVTATMSFLSLVFWAFVLGPLGALLAIPMTLLVKSVLIDADPRAEWINIFIATQDRLNRTADQRTPDERTPDERTPDERTPDEGSDDRPGPEERPGPDDRSTREDVAEPSTDERQAASGRADVESRRNRA